jgi:hypothetical protein
MVWDFEVLLWIKVIISDLKGIGMETNSFATWDVAFNWARIPN